MNTILIDDELQTLDMLERKIIQLSNIEVLGKFTNPHQGLIEVSKQQPDIVFIDISMPQLNGLELARLLKYAIPDIKVVFLATSDQYAKDAFEIQAEDYILKPIEKTRLQKAIDRISIKRKTQEPVYQPMISCFGKLHFRYYENDKDILDVSWRTSKAREIFSYLVHKRGEMVRKDVLVDLFWPEFSVKDAFNQLYSAIYQIRRLLTSIEFDIQIISSENSYRLEINKYLIDVDVWEEGIETMPNITSENIESHENLLFLYKGAYFEEEGYEWSMNERERLRVRWINHMKRIVNYYYSVEAYDEAILLYLYYQKLNPFINETYFELMKLYAHFDNRCAVEKQYRLLIEMSEDEFGEKPDGKVIQWYEHWKSDR